MNNLEILSSREKRFNNEPGARVGDYLQLPYGMYTRFTHDHGDQLQTGGGAGSYYLGNSGYCDYSGGLDSGLKHNEIELTSEVKPGAIWFFNNNEAKADNGFYTDINFRVFKLKDGANTEGLPQIRKYEKMMLKKEAEIITTFNGNDQPMSQHLPEIYILEREINQVAIDHIFKNTGLQFAKEWHGYKCQPLKSSQIVALFLTYNFNTTYYNNSDYNNTLLMTFNNK